MEKPLSSSLAELDEVYTIMAKLERNVHKLCNLRQDNSNRYRWEGYIDQIKKDIKSEQILMFVGTFSTGKSTLANALMGTKLLPMANRPCTSVVTEIHFKRNGCGHKGKEVDLLLKEGPEEDFDELIGRIDGSGGNTGIATRAHHVELYYDLESLDNPPEDHPLFMLAGLNVKIVDCPGYGAKYFTDEEIIYQYIDKASVVFWISDPDRFGGEEDVERLKNISKRAKTGKLIPLITKADTINQVQREQIKEKYKESFGNLFRKTGPICFVAAEKWLEMLTRQKELEKDEINKLEMESGMHQLFHDINKEARPFDVNNAKVDKAIRALAVLYEDIYKCAEKEEYYLLKKANEKGWNKDEKYKKLEEIRREVLIWIYGESERTAGELEEVLTKELTDLRMKGDGDIDDKDINETVTKILEEGVAKRKKGWEDYLRNKYVEYAKEYMVDIKTGELKLQKIDLGEQMVKTIGAVLQELKKKPGATSASLLGCALLAGALIAGGPVAPMILGIGGAVSLFCGGVNLTFPVVKAVTTTKDAIRKKTEAHFKKAMKVLGFGGIIKDALENANEVIYNAYKENFNDAVDPIVGKMEECTAIKDEISGIKEHVLSRFDEFFGKGKVV